MEDFRSKSCGDDKMQIESYIGERQTSHGVHGFRSYNTSYASSMPQVQMDNREMKFKKGKGGGSSSKNWSFNDPEIQRKKRIASYKLYAVEGKMKGSFRN
ncbi:hypothetical protein IFM89_016676 [Coptis chinensis]|uniref:Uncharacterized protein n=1 Tax=Coptis chinensis TaxID=261450 RepID=A0A835IRX3_9MAGN|nr:hypothetical protein IFM89_016676 [Coptis chinensis]